jgi:hypothetical protein
VSEHGKHARSDDEKPVRPARSSDIPPPLEDEDEPAPASVRTSVWLWISAGVVAALTLVYGVLDLDARQAEIEADVLVRQPDISASTLDGVVLILTAAAIGGIAIPAVVQVILAMAMGRGRNGARIALAILGVLFLPAVLIAGGTLAGPGSILTNYAQLGTIAMMGLMFVALVAMFLPSANAWFRGRRR